MLKSNIKIFCDGGSRGNPGPAASAFAVMENEEVVHKGSKFLGEATNNVAEYQAVLMALDWLTKQDLSDVETVSFVLDSELVTKQLNGLYKIKNQTLRKLITRAKALERKIDTRLTYSWSPRSKNKTADGLVNEELDKNI